MKRVTSMKRLTFKAFQLVNHNRCVTKFKMCADWTLNDWAVAMLGEAGKMCNLLKKVKRGDFTIAEKREEILKELADVITYADLMISKLDANTDEVIKQKFYEVSVRVGYIHIL